MHTIDPSPREFCHTNRSNPSLSWGDKYERHCIAGTNPEKQDVLIGDSHLERLSRPALSTLSQNRFASWTNCSIGGDRAEHILWRVQHGGFPSNPRRAVLCSGSNNIRNGSHKHATQIADTILQTVSHLISTYPSIDLTVLGILPRENKRQV